MRQRSPIRALTMGLVFCAVAAIGAPVEAQGLFGRGRAPAKAKVEVAAVLTEVDRALEEDRLIDAGRLLDSAYVAGETDARLILRSGELHLARGRLQEAERNFSTAANSPELKARALQGKGVALSRLGRSGDAIAALTGAVEADPSLWRAWNALGVEKDRRKDWPAAEQAYAKALAAPGSGTIVLNNRGYSRLLQGRYDEASADFVAALQRDPGLAAARTNLRLAIAMRGDYERATTVSGAEDRATILNNAGFIAVLRGDLDDAERMFQQSIEARGAANGRALENLAMVRALKTAEAAPTPAPVTP